MSRWILAIVTGVILGLIGHLLLILGMPAVAQNNVWIHVAALGEPAQPIVLEQPGVSEDNPFGLDPEMVYSVCRFDLSQGPGVFSGTLPEDFWSVSIFDRSGLAVYSTTNRSGVGSSLQMGIFNPAQTRLLAEQQFEIAEGLLIVEAPRDEVFAVVRLSPPHKAMRARYEKALTQLQCGHLRDPDITSGTADQG